ncbi:MAG TPA: hypothetical protein DCZ10_15710 [Pelotomaculum sp.]|nr:hypothetical protein [Pelotomaculum sp.]
MATLPLSDIVNVTLEISPMAAVRSGFNLGLIIGNSAVIPPSERVRLYSGLTAMIEDGFTTSDPEYSAATLYFGQNPRPTRLAVGRWGLTDGPVVQAVMACRAANSEWYACTVCGAESEDVLAIASYIEAAEPKSAFFYTTADTDVLTGTALTAGYETGAADPSTDISGGTANKFKIAVDGDASDPPDYQGVTLALTGLNTGNLIAAAMQEEIRAIGGAYSAVTVSYADGVYIITSGTTGLLSRVRVANGDTNNVAAALKIGAVNGAVDTDGAGSIMSDLKEKQYMRTLGQYSTVTDAAAAILGYAMGANTGVANSAYTLAYKTEVGVSTEDLTLTQVATIKGQNGNVYISRGNTYNLFEQGIMADGTPFDEVINLDMLSNDIQLACMDLLTSVRKVPQTEDGVTMLIDAITGPCVDARNRGFIAPGVWKAEPILTLNTGDALSQGFLVLSESIASQSASDRSARISPPIYVPIKLAGAIEHVNITVKVNR